MSTRQHPPEGIEEMHPGPELCRVLAGLDLVRLAGHDLVVVLRAWDRQVAYTQSQWLDAMVEVGTVVPGPDEEPRRTDVLQDGAEHEVRAGLCLSRPVAASRQTEGAALRWRHPALRAALVAGRIDLARTQTCVREVAEVGLTQGNAAIEAVLPEARSLTTGEIVVRLREYLCAIDPEASARRHEAAVAARRLRGYRHRDGTIDLCAENLPPERAAAMSARVDAIVMAVRRAGHPGMVRVLRVDVCSAHRPGCRPRSSLRRPAAPPSDVHRGACGRASGATRGMATATRDSARRADRGRPALLTRTPRIAPAPGPGDPSTVAAQASILRSTYGRMPPLR